MVHDALMTIGAGLVTETVDLLLAGKVDAIPQEEFIKDVIELRPAPKIFKDTCRIDWNQPLKKIYDFIRGLSPYPAAWTELVAVDGSRQALKVYQAENILHHIIRLLVLSLQTQRAISISWLKMVISVLWIFNWLVRNGWA